MISEVLRNVNIFNLSLSFHPKGMPEISKYKLFKENFLNPPNV